MFVTFDLIGYHITICQIYQLINSEIKLKICDYVFFPHCFLTNFIYIVDLI